MSRSGMITRPALNQCLQRRGRRRMMLLYDCTPVTLKCMGTLHLPLTRKIYLNICRSVTGQGQHCCLIKWHDTQFFLLQLRKKPIWCLQMTECIWNISLSGKGQYFFQYEITIQKNMDTYPEIKLIIIKIIMTFYKMMLFFFYPYI